MGRPSENTAWIMMARAANSMINNLAQAMIALELVLHCDGLSIDCMVDGLLNRLAAAWLLQCCLSPGHEQNWFWSLQYLLPNDRLLFMSQHGTVGVCSSHQVTIGHASLPCSHICQHCHQENYTWHQFILVSHLYIKHTI